MSFATDQIYMQPGFSDELLMGSLFAVFAVYAFFRFQASELVHPAYTLRQTVRVKRERSYKFDSRNALEKMSASRVCLLFVWNDQEPASHPIDASCLRSIQVQRCRRAFRISLPILLKLRPMLLLLKEVRLLCVLASTVSVSHQLETLLLKLVRDVSRSVS